MRLIKPDDPHYAAALQLLAGRLTKAPKVEPEHYDLSNLQVLAKFPAFAAVSRAKGTLGDGNDRGTVTAAPSLHDNVAWMVLLELMDEYLVKGKHAQEMFLAAIGKVDRGDAVEPPEDALAALTQYHADKPPAEPKPRPTPMKRIGTDEIALEIRKPGKGDLP